MKKFFLLISIFAILHAQGQITFEKTYTTTKMNALVQCNDEGYCMVGDYYNANGQAISFISRTDKYGEMQWQREFSFSNYTFCNTITNTNDGQLLVAGISYISNSELYLMKVNQDGDSIWCKTYNFIIFGYIGKIITIPDGGFVLVGEGIEFIGGHERSFGYAIRFDQNGNIQWYKRIEDGNEATFELPQSIIMYQQNGLALCGYSCDTTTGNIERPLWVNVTRLDSMGEIVFSREYKIASGDKNYCGNDLCQDNQGNLVVCASPTYGPHYLAPIWLLRIDDLGDTLFTKTITSIAYYTGLQSLLKVNDSGFTIGTTYSQDYITRAMLIKVDSMFSIQWKHEFYGLNQAQYKQAIATTDGGYAILGTTYDLNNQPYGYLAKTDEDGLITGIGETLTGRKPVPYAIEPNPIAGQTISLRASEGFQGLLHFEVLSSTGQCVYKGLANPGAGSTVLKIELPNFVKGLYILKVLPQNAATKSSAYKLIIN